MRLHYEEWDFVALLFTAASILYTLFGSQPVVEVKHNFKANTAQQNALTVNTSEQVSSTQKKLPHKLSEKGGLYVKTM